MKFNTTYTPQLPFKDSLVFYEKARQTLIHFLEKKLKLQRIIAPAFFPSASALQLQAPLDTRAIDFDMASDYRIGEMPLSHTGYLRDFIVEQNEQAERGYYVESSYVWRDSEESPVSTAAKHELTGQLVSKKVGATSSLKLATALYEEITNLAHEALVEHKIKNIYPNQLVALSAQQMEYEYGDLSPLERERAQVEVTGAYALLNPSLPLVTGHVHRELSTAFYDQRDVAELFLQDRVNIHPLKVASIARVATGAQLLAQLGDEPELKADQAMQKLYRYGEAIYEVKINLPLLVMALLAKGHIAEVQPDVESNEKKVVKLRYKIDTY